jgi:Tol biopolymer transport system component
MATLVLGLALALAGTGCGESASRGALGRASPPGHGILFLGRGKSTDDQPRIYLWRSGVGAKKLGYLHYAYNAGSWSPDWRSIVYSVFVNPGALGPWIEQMYVMSSDGKHRKKLVLDDWSDSTPSWSPNGRQVVYDMAINADDSSYFAIDDVPSGHQSTFPNPWDADPAWGKPGIAYVDNKGIKLMDPKTGRSHLLLALKAGNPGLAWSSSGVLAVLEDRRIVLVSARGSVLGDVPLPDGTTLGSAVWSPNGKQILMVASHNAGVWVVTVGTTVWRRLRVPLARTGRVLGWR